MVELSIVIPAYNEGQRIQSTLEKYLAFFDGKLDYEIFVVLNGCVDNTLDIVKKFNIKYIDIKEAIGKGGAVIEGFKKVKGDYIAFVDADSSTEPDQLYNIFNELKKDNKLGGVIGSRWMKGSKITKYQPLKRVIASRVYNLMVRIILGLPYKDTQAGAKVFTKGAIKSIVYNVIPVGWEFDVALLCALRTQGFEIKEVPITWADTLGSSLKVTKTAPKMLISLIKIRLENSFLRKYTK